MILITYFLGKFGRFPPASSGLLMSFMLEGWKMSCSGPRLRRRGEKISFKCNLTLTSDITKCTSHKELKCVSTYISTYSGNLSRWIFWADPCHFFFNFRSWFWALFALSHLFQLIPLVNHACRRRKHQVLDPPPQV